MKIVSIVGTQPQFIKLAPIAWRAKEICEHLLVGIARWKAINI